MHKVQIREGVSRDSAGIEKLYPLAFPDEDLMPVVKELIADGDGVLSLVAEQENAVVGHVAFSRCSVDGHTHKYSLLAPLAVTPKLQKQGVGSALIKAGFEAEKQAGVDVIFVLGDPAYYGRFGFRQEDIVEAPYPVPVEWREAWQSANLGEEALRMDKGKLIVLEPWRRAELWAD